MKDLFYRDVSRKVDYFLFIKNVECNTKAEYDSITALNIPMWSTLVG